jgi:hypothetical protein
MGLAEVGSRQLRVHGVPAEVMAVVQLLVRVKEVKIEMGRWERARRKATKGRNKC